MKSKVSFRIGSDELDPNVITTTLGIEADNAHRKGDPNTALSKKGKLIKYSPFSTGLWCIESKENEYAVLDHHIKSLLSLLVPMKAHLIEMQKKGYKMDMFCGVFTHEACQPGFLLSPSVMLQLGELGIELGICIY